MLSLPHVALGPLYIVYTITYFTVYIQLPIEATLQVLILATLLGAFAYHMFLFSSVFVMPGNMLTLV